MHNAFNGLFAKIGCSGSQAARRLREELGDARTLLIGTAGTMISAWPSLLGLSIVALQVASSHYSPRLLGNFLHDRHNQVVLGVFVATFACNTAGLYIVGMSGGRRVEEFPRLTGTGAILLLFASLGFLVYFIDHLAHSIQLDTMTDVVRKTRPSCSLTCGHRRDWSASSANAGRADTGLVLGLHLVGASRAPVRRPPRQPRSSSTWCPASAIMLSRTRLSPGGGRTDSRTLVHGLPSDSESETTLQGCVTATGSFSSKTQDKWFNGIQENLATPLTSSEPVPQ